MAGKTYIAGLTAVIISVIVSYQADEYIRSNYPEMPSILSILIPPVIAFTIIYALYERKKR